MATVWIRLRADVRARWRVMLGLALLLGLVGGVALTAAAGARRTETAYPRLLAWADASQVTVIVTGPDPTGSPPAGQYFAAGRMFGPASSRQAVIDTVLAAREHLRPGSVLHLIGIPKDPHGSADFPVLLANLVAAFPGRVAARLRPATVLRAE